jgi:hypothetical protein
MNQPTKIYLIYSPAVEDQLELVLQNELIVEQDINVRNVKLAEMSSIHIHDGLNHALLWAEQKDYPLALQIAYQKEMSLGFLPVIGDKPSQF